MSAKPKAGTIEVFEGVYITPVKQSKYLQIYFRHENRTYRKSAQTADIDLAKKAAAAYYKQVLSNPSLQTKKVPFADCADRYLNSIKHEAKHQYHKETYERHFLPFFGNFGTVANLSEADVSNYMDHRRDKGPKVPTPSTLNRENVVLRQLLKYSERVGLIKKAPSVPHLSEKSTKNRRPHFTLSEYRILRKTARSRIGEAQRNKLLHRQIDNRRLIYDVIIFLTNSGLRVGELHSLTWRDVDWANGDLKLPGIGKVNSRRTVVLKRAGINALRRIQKRRLAQHGGTQAAITNELVVALPDGTPVKNLKKAFGSLLQATQIATPANGIKHSLTSLRHTYATFAITNKVKRVPKSGLAKQMGTSQKMIEQHYGHEEVDDFRDLLN